jgi:hypothetical protein
MLSWIMPKSEQDHLELTKQAMGDGQSKIEARRHRITTINKVATINAANLSIYLAPYTKQAKPFDDITAFTRLAISGENSPEIQFFLQPHGWILPG